MARDVVDGALVRAPEGEGAAALGSHAVCAEVNWYSFSSGPGVGVREPNEVCARVGASVSRRALYLLDRAWPVFLSAFGVDNRGGNQRQPLLRLHRRS